MVTKRLLYLNLNLGWIERLLNIKPHVGATKMLLYLDLNER